MEQALQVLQEKGLVAEDQGALLIDLDKYKLAKPKIRKKDGTALYITRDIGEAVGRWEKYKFDKASPNALTLLEEKITLDMAYSPF